MTDITVTIIASDGYGCRACLHIRDKDMQWIAYDVADIKKMKTFKPQRFTRVMASGPDWYLEQPL